MVEDHLDQQKDQEISLPVCIRTLITERVVVVKGVELFVAGSLGTVDATTGQSQCHHGDLDHPSRVNNTVDISLLGRLCEVSRALKSGTRMIMLEYISWVMRIHTNASESYISGSDFSAL
jgi:hypothetical protein